MRFGEGHAADWKDAAVYAPLLHVGRGAFAWEWLRRDNSYRAAAAKAARSHQSPLRWGLHAFEPPDRIAVAARPVWSRETCPYVLEATAVDDGEHDERLDLERLGSLVSLVVDSSGTEHLLLSDGSRAIRVDIVSGTLRARPALLRYRLEGLCRVEEALLVLRQLIALSRTGRFSSVLHPPERRAGRWILLLRTYDALLAGATQREIAEWLFGLEATEPRWRVQASSVRSRVQRLVREARRTAAGGYRSFLSRA